MQIKTPHNAAHGAQNAQNTACRLQYVAFHAAWYAIGVPDLGHVTYNRRDLQKRTTGKSDHQQPESHLCMRVRACMRVHACIRVRCVRTRHACMRVRVHTCACTRKPTVPASSQYPLAVLHL